VFAGAHRKPEVVVMAVGQAGAVGWAQRWSRVSAPAGCLIGAGR